MMKYGSSNITYDAIGNPLQYRDGITFTWSNGRQLQSYTKNNNTINYTYDSSGVRLSKSDGGTTHTYLYNSGLLIQETIGEQTLDYSYTPSGAILSVRYKANANDTGTYYYYALNSRDDVIGLCDSTGALYAKYTYDVWGNPVSVTNASGVEITSSTDIANIQPLRYRSYYYDYDTGFYYLQSRYYDPVTHRFVNADGLVSTGTGVLGYNMFSYCNNDSVSNIDSSGNRHCEATTVSRENKDNRSISCAYSSGREKFGSINYDVPVYNQGQRNLCWAYCQVMTESYSSGTVFTQAEADVRALEIAISVNGDINWNSGNWSTNTSLANNRVTITDKVSLWRSLRNGPVYAYYWGEDAVHMVLITGIDRWNNTIYTNNPWGISGSQSFEEFQQGFLGMPNEWDCSFNCIFTINWER